MMIRLIVALILCMQLPAPASPQTCCSGGVPLTGNLGMPYGEKGTWQFSLSWDHNRMTTLMDGKERLVNDSRKRVAHSILLETAWSISSHISISGLFTWLDQSRTIDFLGNQNTDRLRGVGDAVLMLNWKVVGDPLKNWELLVGAGPKIPLGRSDLRSEQGFRYNADLQPGSGAWDAVGWALLSASDIYRPSSSMSLRAIYRFTGTNPDYLGSTSYRFGNELQLIAGISDQLVMGKHLVDPSVMVRYRLAGEDLTGGSPLPNTGGQWIYLIPGMVYHPRPDLHFSLGVEVPVYRKLEGIQLTTDYRITAGLYFRLLSKSRGTGQLKL